MTPLTHERASKATFEDFLRQSNNSPCEYVAGTIFELQSEADAHATLASNVFEALWQNLKPAFAAQGFRPLKVQSAGDEYGYLPDVCVVHATEIELDYLVSPIVVIEVLSPSTARVDRGEKRLNYLQVPSLQEYVLVAQDIPKVEVIRRRDAWTRQELYPGDTLTLESIGLSLSLATIYQTITF
jgi:Uma2 family endonuclease